MRYKFSRIERLTNRKEFNRVFQRGTRYRRRLVELIILSGQERRKFGVCIPRSFGKAVKRNRAKRLLKEAYRLTRHLLRDDLYIIARPFRGMLYRKCQDVIQEMMALYREAGILRSEDEM